MFVLVNLDDRQPTGVGAVTHVLLGVAGEEGAAMPEASNMLTELSLVSEKSLRDGGETAPA